MQLTIPFKFEPEFYDDDFVICQSNIDAHRAIYNTGLWPAKRLMIIGEAGSGKSHLVNIWAKLQNATVINPENINAELQVNGAIAIEDMDLIQDDIHLFHLLNNAYDVPVLLTCSQLKKSSLADLHSRINACYKVIIKTPSSELLKIILMKSLVDRQLKVSKEVLEYIVTRMERSFSYVKTLVAQIDRASAVEKCNITIPFVRKIIANTIMERMDNNA